MNRLLAVALLQLAGAAHVCSETEGREPAEKQTPEHALARLQGTWGYVPPADTPPAEGKLLKETLRFVFDGDKLTASSGSQKVFTVTVKLDPAAKPKRIDLLETAGDGKRYTKKGIYQLNGEILQICYGDKRPAEFKDDKSAGSTLIIMKRVKPGR